MEAALDHAVDGHRGENVELQYAHPLEHPGEDGREGDLKHTADLREHLEEGEKRSGGSAVDWLWTGCGLAVWTGCGLAVEWPICQST